MGNNSLKVQQLVKEKYIEQNLMPFYDSVTDGFQPTDLNQDAGQIYGKRFLNIQTLQQPIPQFKVDGRKKAQMNQLNTKPKYPFSAIGYLYVIFDNGVIGTTQTFGTGSLISKNLVLTCAHNVYNRYTHKLASEVFFTPSLHGKKGAIACQVERIFYPKEYKTDEQRYEQWDFAVLDLGQNCNLSTTQGYLGINSEWKNLQQEIMLYGYPNDKTEEENNLQLRYIWGDSRKPLQIKKDQIFYDIFTAPGQSGSPIFIKKSENNFQVVGVHTGKKSQNKCNRGIKFNEKVRNYINDWLRVVNKKLDLSNNSLLSDDIYKFVNKESWNDLKILDLINNKIQAPGIKYLTKDENKFSNLQILLLGFNQIKDKGIDYLTRNKKMFKNLKHLDIGKNFITAQGLFFLVRNGQIFPDLKCLELRQNYLSDKAIKFLTKNPNVFSKLEQLNLYFCNLNTQSISILTNNYKMFPKLRKLQIGKNSLGEQQNALQYLFSNQYTFSYLQTLYLHENSLTAQHIKIIFKNPNVYSSLKSLNLQINKIGFQGVQNIIESKQTFPMLKILRLKNNGVQKQYHEHCHYKLQQRFKQLKQIEL